VAHAVANDLTECRALTSVLFQLKRLLMTYYPVSFPARTMTQGGGDAADDGLRADICLRFFLNNLLVRYIPLF
jgi:hypothetical protein